MELTKHCRLCDNRLFEMASGTSCALTKEKPNFKDKCPDIVFGKNYEDVIREINVEHHLVKMTKANSIANFAIFLAIGIAVIILGYYLWTQAWSSGVISTVPIIIMGVGVLVLPMAFGPMNKYRQEISVARPKKDHLDALLAQYNIQYTIDIKVKTDILGNKEVDTDLKFLRKHYK